MTDRSAERPLDGDHVLGRIRGRGAGPSLIALAGIHGNEPAGIEACRRVLDGLRPFADELRGEFVALVGNLGALERGVRFIDRDLNRAWTPDNVEALNTSPREGEPAEHRQQRELLERLGRITFEARGPLYFLDLHTSSAAGPPFVTVGDTLRNRRFARNMPLPLILGLEEQVDGALLELLNNVGFVTMGAEAGRHDAPESADFHESVLWLALESAGLLPSGACDALAPHRERLQRAGRDAPSVIEVRYRHAIEPVDEFRMKPGFANFQAVEVGQVLAQDRRGPILVPEDGLVLLPLYQGQGDDGFFICREVQPFWLRVSAVLRHLHVGALMRFLPGVRRPKEDPTMLIVDTRVAWFYPLEIFHLLGFRKVRRTGDELIVSRRRYDLTPPPRFSLVWDSPTQ